MNQEIDVRHIRGFIRRRKKIFLIFFLSIFPASIIIAFAMTPLYRSQSLIMIENQQIPKDYVRSTVTSYVEERLQMITRHVMSRPRLLAIIDKFNLYSDLREKTGAKALVEKMRSDIMLETISADVMNKKTGQTNTATIAFTLSYRGPDPAVVQKVAEELSSLYLKEDVIARKKMVATTTSFLEQEAEKLKEQIHLYEEKISVFKRNHIGELPENYSMILQGISRLENDLARTNTELRSLEERKIYLEGELEKVEPLTPVLTQQGKVVMNPNERLKSLRLDLLSLQSVLSEKHPDIIRLKREIAELEQQIGDTDDSVEKVRRYNELNGQLAVLQGTLGPKHPDVIAFSKQVELLSDELKNSGTAAAVEKISGEKPDNPAYISLKTQIASAEASINSLIIQKNKIDEELVEYNRKIANSPIVEKEYKELTRDYDSAMRRYNDIVNKVLEAKLAQGLESGQHGERFIVTEPPALPEKPYKPNRIAIILLGFMLAAGAGVTVSAVQENLDRSVKSSEELSRLTGAPVISVISLVTTEYDRRSRYLKALFLLAVGVFSMVMTLWLINYYRIPVDNLWEVILERSHN